MGYVNVTDKTAGDTISAADYNQLMENIRVLGGNGTSAPESDIQTLYEALYPIGSFYVQYPDAESNDDATAFPTTKRPATLFGGTWAEQFATDYVFFKTGATDGQTRTNGLSADQFQGHLMRMWGYNTGGSGAGLTIPVNNNSGSQSLDYDAVVKSLITNGVNGTPRTGSFTEPRNRLMKIWKRTA